MKKISLLFLISLYATLVLHAQVSKTIQVDIAGSLSTLLTATEISTITDLTVTGVIDSRDFVTMKSSMPSLHRIDLKGATVSSYGNDPTNAIPASALKSNSQITSFIFPNSVTTVGENAFSNCTGLTSLTIPNTVTTFGTRAFSSCSGLNTITIPNAMTTIGYGAFSGCSGLRTLNIPNSVNVIGTYAFDGCLGLTSLTIPNSVTTIGWQAFSNCSGLTVLSIPNSVIKIDFGAFASCSSLTSLTISNSVTTIERNAFSRCSSLTSITIPNSVTTIGESAFSSCPSLRSITIPNSVTTIEAGAFYECSGLTEITIPNSVNMIGDYAFYGCQGLKSLTIPSSVTTIASKLFAKCTGLADLTIPNSVTTIGDEAFSGCTNLQSIHAGPSMPAPLNLTDIYMDAFFEVSKSTCTLYVPNGSKELYKVAEGWKDFSNIVEELPVSKTIQVSTAGNLSILLTAEEKSIIVDLTVTGVIDARDFWTMRAMPNLQNIDLSGATVVAYDRYPANAIPSYTFYCDWGCDKLKKFTFPSAITTIGESAFGSNNGIDSFHIPSTVTAIERCALPKVINQITVDANNLNFSSLDGVLFDKSQQRLIQCPTSKTGSYSIPSTVITIADSAFINCKNLNYVTIPSSVTTIGDKAFRECSGLTSVTIPNTVNTIGYNAFGWCSEITSLSIPNSATTIKLGAFGYCSKLKSIHINSSIPPVIPFFEYDIAVFESVPKTTCILYVPKGSINLYKTTEGWKDFAIIVEEGSTINTITKTACSPYVLNKISYTASNTYTQTLPNTSGGDSVIVLHLTISTPKISAAAVPSSINAGESSVLTASGGLGYKWSNNISNVTQKVNPALSTTYTVTGTDANGCSNTAQVVVNIKMGVTVIASPAKICIGDTVLLTANVNGGDGTYRYAWSNGETTATTSAVLSTATANYSVTVTDALNQSVIDTLAVISSGTKPVISVTPATATICKGNTATLKATGGSTYIWEQKGLMTASVSYIPDTTTTYFVTGTATNGCSNTGKAVVIVIQPTTLVTHPSDISACPSQTAKFSVSTVGGSNNTYQWQYKTTSSTSWSNCADYVTTYSGSKGNTLLVKCSNRTFNNYQYRCQISNSCTTVYSNPALLTIRISNTVTKNVTICKGTSYLVGTHSYTEAGTYRDTLINSTGCDSIVISTISFYADTHVLSLDNGTSDVRNTATSCGESLLFKINGSTASNIKWLPADNLSSPNDASTFAYPNKSISYIVNFTNSTGCEIKDTIDVSVSTPCTGSMRLLADTLISKFDTIRLVMNIENAVDLYALYPHLIYDSKYLTLCSSNEGDILGTNTINTAPVITGSSIDFGATKMGADAGFTGTGIFYTFLFTPNNLAIPDGYVFDFYLDNISAYNSTGTNEYFANNGLVRVKYTNNVLVWPGDLNNSGIVTVADLLPIGYFYNAKGTIRNNASLSWIEQSSALWGPDKLNKNSSAFRVFADGNGDGTISLADQTSVGINLGKKHKAFGVVKSTSSLKDMTIEKDTLIATSPTIMQPISTPQNCELKIDLSSSEPSKKLYGIAFHLLFDAEFIDISTIEYDYSGSLLGVKNTDFISIENSATVGKVDIGITRFSNENVNTEGHLLSIRFKVLKSTKDSIPIQLVMEEANDNTGNSLAIASSTAYILVQTNTTGLTLSQNSIILNASASNTTVTVKSTAIWSAVSNASWLSISPANGGIGTNDVSISATTNPFNTTREAQVSIISSNGSQTITITQRGADMPNNAFSLELTASSTNVCAGESISLSAQVTGTTPPYNYSWSDGTAQNEKCTVIARSTGYYYVTVTDASNNKNVDSVLIAVHQTSFKASALPDTIQLGENSLLSASGGIGYVWTNGVTSASQSVKPDKTEEYSVSITDANGCSANISTKVAVIAPVADTVLQVSQNSVQFDAVLDSIIAISVKAGGTWTVHSDQPWVSVVRNNSTNSFEIVASENKLRTPRSASITIETEYKTQIISIVQSAGKPYITISSDTVTVSHLAGSYATITVASNTTWIAGADQAWIVVDPSLQITGDHEMTLTVLGNFGNKRTATVSLVGTGAMQTITVFQDGTTTGVKNEDDQNLMICPNPTNTSFKILNCTEMLRIDVFNIYGVSVLASDVTTDKEISISHLPKGVYSVKVSSADRTVMEQLIVE